MTWITDAAHLPAPTRCHTTWTHHGCERALLLCSCQLLCQDPTDGWCLSMNLKNRLSARPIHTHATCRTFLCNVFFSLASYVCCAVGICYIITGYIGEFEIIDDHRANKIVVELNGRLNKCGVISPRFDVEYGEIEKWIVNLLPSRQFGHIILSTTYGIMTHEEARRKKTGGKILGFFY